MTSARLVERAEIVTRDGAAEAFERAMGDGGLAMLASFPGVRTVCFGRGVEHPDKFMLLVEWESLDAHTAFTQAPVFAEFRAAIMPHSIGGAMEHFEMRDVVGD